MKEADSCGDKELAEAVDLALRNGTWDPNSPAAIAEQMSQRIHDRSLIQNQALETINLSGRIKHAIAITVVDTFFDDKTQDCHDMFEKAKRLAMFWGNWQSKGVLNPGFPKRKEYIEKMTLKDLEQAVISEIIDEEIQKNLEPTEDKPSQRNIQLRVIQIALEQTV